MSELGAPTITGSDSRELRSASLTDPISRRVLALVVLFFVVAGHAWSVDAGLFLDDHAHYEHLKEAGWSFRGSVAASRLGIIGDVMDLWGRQEKGLRFFRPIAFWIMKAEYTLVGWRPAGMHVFMLGWHYLCAMLVAALAMRCFGHRFWAIVAGSLMAIHPGHVATVYWIACQTELLTTAFLLAGVLAYARYARWGQLLFLRSSFRGAASGAEPVVLDGAKQEMSPVAYRSRIARGPKRGFRAAWGSVAILCYALALGCRENALLFPVICVAGDWLFGTKASRPFWRIRLVPLLMLVVIAGYFGLRWSALGGFPMPGRPYIYPVSDPGFAKYILEKVVYYTLGLFGFVPVVPMGGQAYFAQKPLAFYGGFAGTLAVLTIIWSAYRFRRGLLWPLVWIACTIGPLLPVFASSHHLYLPSVGMVLLVTAGLAALGGILRPAGLPPPKAQAAVCGLVLLLHAVGLGLLTWAGGFIYRAGTLTEDILIEDVLERGRPLRDGDHLFFINMPLLAYYAVPAIEEQIGVKNLHGHVLTFSPWLLRMESPGQLQVLDARRIRVRAPDTGRYFEGIAGDTLLKAMGFERMPAPGETIRAKDSGFTVVPVEADAEGIRELEFQFDEPISSPRYHFYFGSPQFLAYPIGGL